MACIIKLKDNHYIEWSKTSDSPASSLLNKEEVVNLLTAQAKSLEIINKKINVEEILEQLEKHGTTDITGAVDLNFILKYNSFSPNGKILSLEELIDYLKNT